MRHTIEIRVIGNPCLSRDLQASFAAESTRHRSISGAARRIAQLQRKSDDWAAATGRWGTVEVIVDGNRIEGFWWDSVKYWGYSPSVINSSLTFKVRKLAEESAA